MDFAVIATIVLALLFLRQELKRIEARLVGTDDRSHDEAVDQAVLKATQSYRSHRSNLELKKKQLPSAAPWDVLSGQNWEEQLLVGAEALRPLAEEAYGKPSVDSYHFGRRALQIPMTFNFAHALATYAELQTEIAINRADWGIKKIEVLGLGRRRNAEFSEMAEAERDLWELERETERLERLLESRRKAVCDAVFEQMRDPTP